MFKILKYKHKSTSFFFVVLVSALGKKFPNSQVIMNLLDSERSKEHHIHVNIMIYVTYRIGQSVHQSKLKVGSGTT